MKQIKLFELKENETWSESWNHIGLFSSKELAEQFEIQRSRKLKKEFNQGPNSFESWYNWHISERTLFLTNIPKNVQKSIENLKKQDLNNWDTEDTKLVCNFILNNFIMKD